MFPCCSRPIVEREIANKELFPILTCVSCALDSEEIYLPANPFGTLELEWVSWEDNNEWLAIWNELLGCETEVVKCTPRSTAKKKKLNAFDKHLELLAAHPRGQYVWYTHNIGLYGNGDGKTPRHRLRDVDVHVTHSTQFVYLLRDIQANVDAILEQ